MVLAHFITINLGRDVDKTGRGRKCHDCCEYRIRFRQISHLQKFSYQQTKQSTSNAKENIETILSKKDQLYKLCKRVDDLEYFIDIVDNQLTVLTKQVETAEKDLGISDNRITSLLRNVLFRAKPAINRNNEQGSSKSFVPVEIFRTEDFFKTPEN